MTALWSRHCVGHGSGLEEVTEAWNTERHGDASHSINGEAREADRDYDFPMSVVEMNGDGRGDGWTLWRSPEEGDGGSFGVDNGVGNGDSIWLSTWLPTMLISPNLGTGVIGKVLDVVTYDGYPEMDVDLAQVTLCRVAALEFAAPSIADVLALASHPASSESKP